jgi:hypothetical protein
MHFVAGCEVTKNHRWPDVRRLFRSIRSTYIDISFVVLDRHAQLPRIAAHLAVLDERPSHLWFQVDFDVFTAVWAADEKERLHRYMMRRHAPYAVVGTRPRSRDHRAR